MDEQVLNDMAELYKEIGEKYFHNSEPIEEKKLCVINLHLAADIDNILSRAEDLEKELENIYRIIREKASHEEILRLISMDEILECVKIRRDWPSALRSVRKGRDLSHLIGYGFRDEDIKELARLHKAKKFRKKIESLLEDCNFHKECGDFSEGNYDEYLRETDADDSSDS